MANGSWKNPSPATGILEPKTTYIKTKQTQTITTIIKKKKKGHKNPHPNQTRLLKSY